MNDRRTSPEAFNMEEVYYLSWAVRKLLRETLAGLGPVKRVLDVGCGIEPWLDDFQANGAVQVVGGDVHPDPEALKKQGPLFSFTQLDASRLPFRDACFDLVWGSGIHQRLQEHERAAGEFARVLRPGGRLVLTFYWSGIEKLFRTPLKRTLTGIVSGLGKTRRAEDYFPDHSRPAANYVLADKDSMKNSLGAIESVRRRLPGTYLKNVFVRTCITIWQSISLECYHQHPLGRYLHAFASSGMEMQSLQRFGVLPLPLGNLFPKRAFGALAKMDFHLAGKQTPGWSRGAVAVFRKTNRVQTKG